MFIFKHWKIVLNYHASWHFFGKFSGIFVAVLCLTIHYAQCDSLLRPELVKIALVCLINRHASGLQQVLKKFSESSCSLTQDLASAKEKKTQGDASHQTRSSSAAISWMGLGERDQVFPWFTLFPLLTLKPEGLNICQVSLVYCRSQVSSCRT